MGLQMSTQTSIDDQLSGAVISVPLAERLVNAPGEIHAVIIDLHRNYAGGPAQAHARVTELATQAAGGAIPADAPKASRQYVFLRLPGSILRKMVDLDQAAGPGRRAMFRIWPDFPVRQQLWHSVATVKADACLRTFKTSGQGIVWAVLDTGVDAAHPHFATHGTLRDLPLPAAHMDFTVAPACTVELSNLSDTEGHGTHVAGIIAGENSAPVLAALQSPQDAQIEGVTVGPDAGTMPPVSGIAPLAKLVSYRVLTGDPNGDPVSNVIAALEHIQEVNGYGQSLVIHGINLSLGYEFEPEWFACGQSPLCVQVDQLVRSGVVVVVAAGNTGLRAPLSINDPGNAERAITVGATHRDMPHTYGVSYFSSKGPTGDGRRKPDLVAPGERIVSCHPGGQYNERSGTSMAAAHVSGIAAGLLSARTEFLGEPEKLKQFLLENCVDLGRDPAFQGRGLVDMMRAIQAV